MKFLIDINLGKLSKWLRILGFDTVVYHGIIDNTLISIADKENRLFLIRKQNLNQKNNSERLFVVKEEKIGEQIHEITKELSLCLDPQKFFSRCVKCNEVLLSVSKDNIEDDIPDYVMESMDSFLQCPTCKQIYWPGTHRTNMLRLIKNHTRFHLP